MSHEIDFLAVGEGERGGDAICFRFGNLNDVNKQQIVVIDGGTRDSGDKLVKHINSYYKTNKVDLAILTHPDQDHASGMREVLEQMDVKRFGMHKPWDHAENIKHLFEDNNMSTAKLKDHVKENLEAAHECYEIAQKKKIPSFRPFSDDVNLDGFKILSPSVSFYESLLPEFTCTPEPKKASFSLVEMYKSAAEKVTTFIDETWDFETLSNPNDADQNSGTRPENNSSVVLYLELDDEKILLTGDAGSTGLYEAYRRASFLGIDLTTVNFYQIPHHGSKRNVGPAILNAIVGPKVGLNTYSKVGYISCPKKGEPKHPSKKVINAFIRRGVKVFTTSGKDICHGRGDRPNREWEALEPAQFNTRVEED